MMDLTKYIPYYILFVAGIPVKKDQAVSSYTSRFVTLFTAPIEIKAMDKIVVDRNTGTVELVERAGIVVYRRAWLN